MREVRDSGSKMTTVADYLLQRGSSRMLTRHRRGERTNPAAMVVDREELGAHPDEINYDLPLGTEIRTQAGQTDTQITAKFLTGRPGPGGWMKPFSISTNNQIFSKYTQSGIHNMAQAGALTPTEKTLIDGLIAVKLEAGTATLAVVMLTRRFSRPENELLDLVAAYPALNLSHVRSQALTEVKSRDWVVEVPSDYAGPSLIQAAPDLHSALSELIPRLEVDLKSLIRQEPPVRVLGHMGTPEIYDTFIIRLQQAQSDIALPMVMTTHELGAIDTLKERANAGVRVRVLRASADLAEEIRGRSAAAQAKERLKGWRAHAKGQRNLEVRITRHARDIRDASSMLIDGNLLRYDIYDNETERTTDGVMIEVAGSSPSNLARMFEDRFNEAWSRARPLGFWRSVGWLLKRWWQVVLFFIFIAGLMLLREEHPGAVSLLLGAMLGYLVNHIDTIFGKVRQIWMRLMV